MATTIAVPWTAAANGHEQDARRDVVEAASAADVTAGKPAPEPCAELTAEDVYEEQQEHDRHSDPQQRHRRVTP